MPMNEYDSDEESRYNTKSNYRSSVSPSNHRGSILKNSIKKLAHQSDEEEEDTFNNSARLSNRYQNKYDKFDDRYESISAKPPSGRAGSSLSNRTDKDYSTSSKSKYTDYESSKRNLPAITYTAATKLANDSDDSLTEKYNKFSKKHNDKLDSRSESIYDKYLKNDISKLTDPIYDKYLIPKDDDMDYKPKQPRSNSLDRLNTATLSSSALNSTKLSKYNSTNNINNDNSSERSYTINSLNTTSMSIREAKNRSYLVGSLSALNGKGLLSMDELDRHFIDRKARVLIATWNMGGVKKPPNNLDELVMPDIIQTMPDIFVIGVQEFEINHKEWEISLQEQIGPNHVKLSSHYHGSIGICLFVKRELIWFCSIVEYEHINFRPVQAPSKTKGSVLITFQLFGTLVCFVCSHFIAGEGNLEPRVENYKQTINNIKLPKKLKSKSKNQSHPNTSNNNSSNNNNDGTENFDIVFWMGDFNFLVTKERDKIEKKVSHLREKRGTNYEDIINHDELNQVMSQDRAFKNFLEGRITFEPTYKYDVNSDDYDTSHKIRIPSYCDRILFKSRHKGSISCYHYDAIRELKLSDHRPVFGLYEVNIRPGVDKVPLSYGDFDRQIYAAGYQRRQMFRAHNVGWQKTSPCVIQ